MTSDYGWVPAIRKFFRTAITQLLVLGVIVVAVVIAILFLQSRLSSPPGTLQLGDCFDLPSPNSTVTSVQHHPCTDSHQAEVFLVTLYTSDVTDYPDAAAFDQFVGTTCTPAFRAYAGIDLSSRSDLALGYFVPEIDGWAQGDRTIECFVHRGDDGTITQSFRAPGSS